MIDPEREQNSRRGLDSLLVSSDNANMTPNGNNAPFATHLAEYVRQARKDSQLTQSQLAELAGVGRRLVSELENAKPTLQLQQVEQVLAVFGRQLAIAKPGEPGRE